MPSKEVSLGLEMKDAKQKIEQLQKEYEEANKKWLEIRAKQPLPTEEVIDFQNNMILLQEKVRLLSDSYTIGLLESSRLHSKRLNNLIIVLIGLTIILGGWTILDIISKFML